MAQVKKEAVREAIVEAATHLFRQNGYSATSVAAIGKRAGVSTSNIYVYFASKLDILFAIYNPWLRERLERLGREIAAMPADDHRGRLSLILDTLWRDIPAEQNGFANNLMQALSTATPEEGYSRDLLMWAERRVVDMLRDSLPARRRDLVAQPPLAHLVFMAFDGFALNYKLQGPSERVDDVSAAMVELLLGNRGA